MLVHAILLLVRAKKSRVVDHALCVYYNIDRNDPVNRIELHDFCHDKHTRKGKELGRGFEHFFKEGIKLENCDLDDPYLDEAKTIICAKEKPKKQVERFDSLVEPKKTVTKKRQEEDAQTKFFTDDVE